MKIKSKTMLGVSLFAMTFSFGATAQTCKPVPSCESLGYTATSCSGDSIKCPFDESKLHCMKAQSLCTPGKIFYTDGTCSDDYDSSKTVLGVIITLNADGSYSILEPTASNSVNSTNATSFCAGITRGGLTAHLPIKLSSQGYAQELNAIGYFYKAINEGLGKISGATKLNNTSFYWESSQVCQLTTTAGVACTDSYTTGYARCIFDVRIDDGGNICTWSGTLDSCPTGCNCSQDTCGGVTKYTITSAQSGYTVSGSTCVANTCSGYDSSSSSIANCSSVSSCTKPTGTVYKCASCNSGYYVSGGTCVANTCSGYNYSSASISYCSSVSSCTKPTGTVYKCASCRSGYSVNSSGGCTAQNTCSGYYSTTSSIANCNNVASCTKSTGGTVYKCTSCKSGYGSYNNGELCLAFIPSGYVCPSGSHNCCGFSANGGTVGSNCACCPGSEPDE